MDAAEIFRNESISFIPILDKEKRLVNLIQKHQLNSLLLLGIDADMAFDFSEFDECMTEYNIFSRPWGFYKTTAINTYFQSKIIIVRPKSQLSLQSHSQREEYWIAVHGNGMARIDDSVIPVCRGCTLFIPKGAKHRLINTGTKESLIIAEIQIGSYFGEDDIIRYEDSYGRV